MRSAIQKTLVIVGVFLASAAPSWAGPALVEPNDVLDIVVYDEAQLTRDYNVSPDGHIDVPFAGQVRVEGLTLIQVGQQLQRALSTRYRDPIVAVAFRERSRREWVYVVGEVKIPGPYSFAAGYTLNDYVGRAGGVTDAGGAESVLILSGSDRKQASLFAEPKSQPPLRAGDTIFVPLAPQQVYVLGEVTTPGSLRFVAGYNVKDYVGQAGGLTRDGSPDNIVVISGTQRTDTSLDPTTHANLLLKAGDTILVPTAPHQVYVLGEVRDPGPVQFLAGMTMLDAVNQTGGPSADADISSVVVYRREGTPEGVVVDYREALRNATSASNILLKPGDTIVLGRAPLIYVSGEVAHPGAFSPLPGYTLADFIGLAGGFLGNANMRNVLITHGDQTTEIVDMHPGGPGAVNGKRKLRPGDSVYVPPRIEKVYVGGEVAHPGEFDVKEGFRVSDYVGLAGGMTDRADAKRALLFREGEERSEADTFNLGKVLSGKNEKWNKELKNGDTVYVPQKLWANRIEDYGILGSLLTTVALWFRLSK
ncbi:MAG: hypothetical protein AUJ92_02705 [Armatimonadetes bacterium CG2_30_59_28]|nr:hypothetical protein [Armatimonadota bacterium]OIO97916.1 MAG: hypothetical protein AUJ92_02705 [Armatimonadetes bacterium CG2_30_59_28]PIU65965.1 MAG: hypothetical protein COS85_06715 [Armatimonadetes bacterium CG07_land_8_20_14_0_80_59_28]PIX38552.1 MAG: hypothetical protein COZ56_20220 [Armatimonadetes bacterium CG_4_8_14_3_um_filter_58_9]PIY48283.1 MAG: hypothetical protein COZ05_03610 [Armatimonadetes bacterium CG_4_10_14_3_um_filter_59_10]PJB71060.1 MAG: hypothetical protein CO095_084